jgi:WD40 repeat protein
VRHPSIALALCLFSAAADAAPRVVWHAKTAAHAAAVGWTPDGARVVVADGAGGLRWLDARDGRELKRHAGGTVPVFAPRLSPDGRTVAWADAGGGLVLDDLASGKRLQMLVMPFDGTRRARAPVAFSRDGRLVARAAGDAARVWDVASGQELATARTPRGKAGPPPPPLAAIALSPDGTRLATADARTLAVWTVPAALRRGASWVPAGRVAFVRGGQWVVAAGSKSAATSPTGALTFWDAERVTPLESVAGGSAVAALAASADGRSIAVAYAGAPRLTVLDVETRAGDEVDARVGEILDLAFDHGGRRVAVLGRGGAVAVCEW